MQDTLQHTLQDFTDRILNASQTGQPLRLRGGGTKDFLGQSLQGEVLDTRGYSGILSYEPSELVITVRCGTPLAEVEAALAEKGQSFAFEPPHFTAGRLDALGQPLHLGEGATIGGMVAAGLSGPARASVGTVRDFVLGARVINGKGEHLTFGGQVMKNVAGYDVSRLLAGSWGQLGLITEVSLKVLPVAPGEATLVCAGVSQAQALKLINQWGGQPLPLNASAWVYDTTASPAQDFFFVRLRGAVAAVDAAVIKMSADVQALGAQVTRMDSADVAADWTASGEQTLDFFKAPTEQDCLWRLSVPQTAPVLDVRVNGAACAQYIEWHGAQRWLWAPASAATQVRDAAVKAGGHATLFRTSTASRQTLGDVDKQVGVYTPLNAVQQRIQNELKKQFDPAGIFNPGRV
ncbi:glycolate oxidase subunit GlcE [Limnohabitans sp. INBF002]|uniref:glycolate oxidase subunit GlcE n=1 Tax=Limnohabitans sp. INBF002 TaxID=2986280 RepID=UPI0024914D0F|nr:glycolate oxidase subunit GlcE [Limnohabitans sp. INBF002]